MSRKPGAGRPGDESLVARWSRLKRAREAGELPEEAEAPEEAAPAPAGETGGAVDDERPDEEILAELGLPEPETLGPDDDFSAYLEARLPERLQRRVLRRLWRVDPVLANLDELVDYGEDFTDAAMSAGVVQTVYQVGKGMVSKLDEAEEDRASGAGADAAASETADEPGVEASARCDDEAGEWAAETASTGATGAPQREAPPGVVETGEEAAGREGPEVALKGAVPKPAEGREEGASQGPTRWRPRIRFRVPES